MSRTAQIAVFLTVAVGLLGGIHYYFWARLVRDTALPAPWRTIATALVVVLGLGLPLALVFGRRAHGSWLRLVAWPAYVWMGMVLLLLLALLATDVVRLVAALSLPADEARRLALRRALAAAAGTVAGALGVAAMRSALGPVTVEDVHVELARLPPALDGTTVVQLTDLHVGPTIGRGFIEDVVRRVNELAPDLVAITGDLVDGPVDELREAVAPLAGLRARRGVYFVTGNHEYYAGAEAWTSELRRLGIRVLRNERVSVGDGDAWFDVAGVDDYHSLGLAPGHGPDLPRALAGRDPSRELVLLAHQPKAIHEAARLGVGLQLSGHTHGGQIWPWGYMVRLQQPYVAGLVREGDAQLYVSRGTGYWGPPMRLAAPAEITRITLRARRA